jgi:uncharacterized protein
MVKLVQELLNGDSIVNDQDDAIEFLHSVGFLEPDPPLPLELAGAFTPSTAVLLLTNQCQLRCTYCYASAGDSKQKTLTCELGYAAIDVVYQNAKVQGYAQYEVAFHGGGEPTMAWRVLKDCVAWARKKPIPAKITLTSNGIWSPKQCTWIIQNVDGLSLSMDGQSTTQDQQRPFSSGIGSSTIVMRNMAELDRHQYPYDVRMTATAPWVNLPRDVGFICEESNCQTIQVEPAFSVHRGGHFDPEQNDLEAFAVAYLEAAEIATQAGRRLYYSGARLGVVTTAFCTAPYNALIVNTDGSLMACYEVTSQDHPLFSVSRIGHVKANQAIIDHKARQHLHDLMSDRRKSCRDCFCYWSCAGGCYTRSFGPSPDGHLYHGNLCELHQRLTKSMLLKEIARGDGVYRAAHMPARRVAPVSHW